MAQCTNEFSSRNGGWSSRADLDNADNLRARNDGTQNTRRTHDSKRCARTLHTHHAASTGEEIWALRDVVLYHGTNSTIRAQLIHAERLVRRRVHVFLLQPFGDRIEIVSHAVRCHGGLAHQTSSDWTQKILGHLLAVQFLRHSDRRRPRLRTSRVAGR